MAFSSLASVVAVSLGIAYLGCGSRSDQACAAGATEQCFCSGTILGAQVCANDGTHWEACVCGTSGMSGAPAGNVAGMSGATGANSSGTIDLGGLGGNGSRSGGSAGTSTGGFSGSAGTSTGRLSASGSAGTSTGRLTTSGSAGGSGTMPGAVDDGTTGKLCTTDRECQTVAGTNRCSNDYTVRITNVPVKIWATSVCIKALPTAAGQGGNCDPTDAVNDPLGQFTHFCDGPDDPSSPGICVALDAAAPQPGQGICYPKCTFKTDGTPATGCAGHNACGLVSYFLDPQTNTVTGYGFCQGACSQDSDCADVPAPPGDAGTYHCQPDIGYCTTTPITKRAKNIGDACSHVGVVNDVTQGACNCASGTTNLGFCTSVCTAGGPPCPNGWVCDTGQPVSLSFAMGATQVGLSKQTKGMIGTCAPPCVAGGPAAQCPTNSTCNATSVAGADCQP